MQPTLIGISGTNGAGKDTVGHLLAERFGYVFFSVSDTLRHEARRRGLPEEREVLREISAQWRRNHGLGVLIDKAVEQLTEQVKGHTGLVLASLRNPAEADRIHDRRGIVIWVDADPHLRYKRIQANAIYRNRTEDKKTFEQFLAEEEAEMHTTGDAATLDMAAVKDRSDRTVINEFDNLDDLATNIAKTLELQPVAA